MTPEPINLAELRADNAWLHDNEPNARLAKVSPATLISLIDTAEAATRFVYESDIVTAAGEARINGPADAIQRLDESLARYTVPKPDAPPANPSNRSA